MCLRVPVLGERWSWETVTVERQSYRHKWFRSTLLDEDADGRIGSGSCFPGSGCPSVVCLLLACSVVQQLVEWGSRERSWRRLQVVTERQTAP